jgi:YfiH family protein
MCSVKRRWYVPKVMKAVATGWTLSEDLLQESRLRALGVRHGLSHRRLGPMRSADARDAMAGAAGVRSPLYLTQVHGARVLQAHEDFIGCEADGWVTDEPGVCIGVFAADCLPLLMWNDALTVVGAVHAGWRGLKAGVIASAVRAFGKLGVAPEAVNVAVGPHISGAVYEVGSEFRTLFTGESVFEQDGTLRFDQGIEALAQLHRAGVSSEKTTVSTDCTFTREEELLSYRRDGKRRNMMAFIECPKVAK